MTYITNNDTNITNITNSQKFIPSYGIACVRKNIDGNYEILMIKKKCSYAFSEFIRGDYDPCRKHDLSYMFDMMTIEEKRIILSMNFVMIWFHSYGTVPNFLYEKNPVFDFSKTEIYQFLQNTKIQNENYTKISKSKFQKDKYRYLKSEKKI